jgi:hypothetical protein
MQGGGQSNGPAELIDRKAMLAARIRNTHLIEEALARAWCQGRYRMLPMPPVG